MMAPRKRPKNIPGPVPKTTSGPQKNLWTPRRRRDLVRLWTLTLLSKEEIEKVLQADDFDPR